MGGAILPKYAYAHFGNLPYDTFLKVGFDQRFMKPSRKTEGYPLAGNSFWRDNSGGIFLGGTIDPFYWRFSYTNGYSLAQRQKTEDNPVGDNQDMLHDNTKTAGYSNLGEVGVGMGFKYDFEELGKLDTMGFFYYYQMSAVDEQFLINNVTGYTSTDRDQTRYGANVNYSVLGANIFAQFIKAEDGALERYAWYIQPSYKIDLTELFGDPDREFLSAVTPLFRYGVLETQNIGAVWNDQLTWDRQEYTIAVITQLYDNVKLKTEYNLDRMDKGTGTDEYGEFIAQLEVKF